MYSGRKMHVDGPLLMGVLALCVLGLVLIFSASSENWNLMWRQGIRLLLSLGVMLAAAQIPPEVVRRLSPHIFIGGLLILALVLVAGYVGKGAQRWLDLGLFRFQPSELMKLGVPMAVAWLLTRRAIPPRFVDVLGAILIIALPTLLVVVQPDLGTAHNASRVGFACSFPGWNPMAAFTDIDRGGSRRGTVPLGSTT